MRARSKLFLLPLLLLLAGGLMVLLVPRPARAPEQPSTLSATDDGLLERDMAGAGPVAAVTSGVGVPTEYPPGTIAGEVVLHFPGEREYRAYLRALAGAGFPVRGRIDALWVLRVGAGAVAAVDPATFGGRMDFSYRVYRPPVPREISPAALARLRPFSASARELGGRPVGGGGAGVLVAVLDSGIAPHPVFESLIIEPLDFTGAAEADAALAHGTWVASVIAGESGLAPAAGLLDLRVLGPDGAGSAFDVAAALVEAVERGADIINLSLGTYADTLLLSEAVRYASERGVLLVAAAGNEALETLAFPAAYSEVLAVTAVDAAGRHALFPNRSDAIDFAAPGVGIRVAGVEGGAELFSGTSAAAPFVTGTLAGLMSGPDGLSAIQAVDRLRRTLNDAGAPGPDSYFGGGLVDWNRIREYGTPGVVDLALAAIHPTAPFSPGTPLSLEVTVQNRGTKWLAGGSLEVRVGDGEIEAFPLGSLGAGEVTTRTIRLVPAADVVSLDVAARILPPEGDLRPGNDVRGVRFGPTPAGTD